MGGGERKYDSAGVNCPPLRDLNASNQQQPVNRFSYSWPAQLPAVVSRCCSPVEIQHSTLTGSRLWNLCWGRPPPARTPSGWHSPSSWRCWPVSVSTPPPCPGCACSWRRGPRETWRPVPPCQPRTSSCPPSWWDCVNCVSVCQCVPLVVTCLMSLTECCGLVQVCGLTEPSPHTTELVWLVATLRYTKPLGCTNTGRTLGQHLGHKYFHTGQIFS